jgi:hypothetical protein
MRLYDTWFIAPRHAARLSLLSEIKLGRADLGIPAHMQRRYLKVHEHVNGDDDVLHGYVDPIWASNKTGNGTLARRFGFCPRGGRGLSPIHLAARTISSPAAGARLLPLTCRIPKVTDHLESLFGKPR